MLKTIKPFCDLCATHSSDDGGRSHKERLKTNKKVVFDESRDGTFIKATVSRHLTNSYAIER